MYEISVVKQKAQALKLGQFENVWDIYFYLA